MRSAAGSRGHELEGKVDRVHPLVMSRAMSSGRVIPGQDPVGHDAEDQGTNQVLTEVIEKAYRVQDLPVRTFPDQRVSYHDRCGVRDGPPVGGEVDDRGP